RRAEEWAQMPELSARLAKVTLRELPSLLFRLSLRRMQMKRREQHRRQIPPVAELAREALDLRASSCKFLRRRRDGEPPVAEARDTLQCVFVVARGAPDRDRFCNGPRLDADIFQTKISAVEGYALFRPEPAHELNRFVETSRSLLERHAAGLELLLGEFILRR